MKPRFRFLHGRYWPVVGGRRVPYAYVTLDAAYEDFREATHTRGTRVHGKAYALFLMTERKVFKV